MIERPSAVWRSTQHEQRDAVAAGTLAVADAYALRIWPPAFLADVDEALEAYQQEAAGFRGPGDDDVFAAVERVVLALNRADDRSGGCIETIEREELCEYIDQVLESSGIDVCALAERRGIDPSELTDAWRDW